MKGARIVIAGGVAAGMSAAFKLRREAPSAEVVVYEAGGLPSYGACGLPYFISGVNPDWTKLIARSAEDIRAQGIDLRLRHRVVKVYPAERRLLVRREESGETFMDRYDEFMAATGARPALPPVEGVDSEFVFTLSNVPDAIAIREAALDPARRRVVIVGAGPIGIELAESFVLLGKEVVLIEKEGRVLPRFEPEISESVRAELASAGVEVRTGESLLRFVSRGGRLAAFETERGSAPADLAVLCLGVKPNLPYLAGGDRLPNGALRVDASMRTSLPHVWAAGDCASVRHALLGTDAYAPMGTNANKQGRVAGDCIARQLLAASSGGAPAGRYRFEGSLGTTAVKALGVEAARTGLGLAEAAAAGVPAAAVVVKAPDHPAYYPDQAELTVKLIYSPPDHRLLGAQIVGRRGAALRIDVFAAAILAGLSAERIGMADLCYAPPFASVWDVIHIAANAVK